MMTDSLNSLSLRCSGDPMEVGLNTSADNKIEKIKISVNDSILGVPSVATAKALESLWQNAEVEPSVLHDLINQGHPYGSWQTSPQRMFDGVMRRRFVAAGVLTINVPTSNYVGLCPETWDFLDESAFGCTVAVGKSVPDVPSTNIIFVLEEPIRDIEFADKVTDALCYLLGGNCDRSRADRRVWSAPNTNRLYEYECQLLSVGMVDLLGNEPYLRDRVADYLADQSDPANDLSDIGLKNCPVCRHFHNQLCKLPYPLEGGAGL